MECCQRPRESEKGTLRCPERSGPVTEPTIVYHPDFLAPKDATELMGSLVQSIAWEQHFVRLFGKSVPCPRLSAWYGDEGAAYAYSGTTHKPTAWTLELSNVRQRIEEAANCSFNSVLLNRYRTGRDSMGWHADDEPELGRQPTVASVSLGARRKMRFRLKSDHRVTHDLWLDHGSLLIMAGETQHLWQHALPKTKRVDGERLNLTFRRIV